MGRWLKEFLAHTPPSLPDIPDTLPTVSGLGVPDIEVSAKITPPDPAEEPTPPLRPGWLVVYRDQRGALCGGCDDRQHGTVKECRWAGVAWTVHLTDGQQLPLTSIRSVGKTDGEGRLVAAWSVRAHGYDGVLNELHDAKKVGYLTQ